MTDDEIEVERMLKEYTGKTFEDALNDVYVDPSEEIEHPPIAISYGDHSYNTKDGLQSYRTPIATYGNFSFVQAPPKVGKSYLMSLLSTVYLNDNAGTRGGDLKGHREGKEVIHFDTEQGKFHASKVFKRPYEITGKPYDGYHTFALRQFSPRDRLAFIEWYLSEKVDNVGLVIIDGVADLCNDVNNIEESNLVVQKIMQLTALYNCHIMTVIHSNFGSDKPTGHLGSFLEKKTETQIELKKNELIEGQVTVSCKRSRGRSFETFDFKIDKYGLPKIINTNVLTKAKF